MDQLSASTDVSTFNVNVTHAYKEWQMSFFVSRLFSGNWLLFCTLHLPKNAFVTVLARSNTTSPEILCLPSPRIERSFTVAEKPWVHKLLKCVEKCFCLPAVSAAHLAGLETTCHLCFLSSPWRSGANDLEGYTLPLHMGLTACECVFFKRTTGPYFWLGSLYVCRCVCACVYIKTLFLCLSVPTAARDLFPSTRSPSASGPVVLPASPVIRTGRVDQQHPHLGPLTEQGQMKSYTWMLHRYFFFCVVLSSKD